MSKQNYKNVALALFGILAFTAHIFALFTILSNTSSLSIPVVVIVSLDILGGMVVSLLIAYHK